MPFMLHVALATFAAVLMTAGFVAYRNITLVGDPNASKLAQDAGPMAMIVGTLIMLPYAIELTDTYQLLQLAIAAPMLLFCSFFAWLIASGLTYQPDVAELRAARKTQRKARMLALAEARKDRVTNRAWAAEVTGPIAVLARS